MNDPLADLRGKLPGPSQHPGSVPAGQSGGDAPLRQHAAGLRAADRAARDGAEFRGAGRHQRGPQAGGRGVFPAVRAPARAADGVTTADQHLWPADGRGPGGPRVRRGPDRKGAAGRNALDLRDGEQVRDFNYVGDVVRALELAADLLPASSTARSGTSAIRGPARFESSSTPSPGSLAGPGPARPLPGRIPVDRDRPLLRRLREVPQRHGMVPGDHAPRRTAADDPLLPGPRGGIRRSASTPSSAGTLA